MNIEKRPVIHLKNITKSYGQENEALVVLRDLNLTVYPGEWISICGASGSGKTTLLNILGCLDLDFSGTAEILGQDASSLAKQEAAEMRLKHISFIHQDFHLLPFLNVLENVIVKDWIASRKADLKKAKACLEALEIQDKAYSRPKQLSGGQKQRTAVARALYTPCEIILADEPTGSLPEASRDSVLEQLKQLHSNGKTIVCVSHDPVVAAAGQRILYLHNGMLLADSPASSEGASSFEILPKTLGNLKSGPNQISSSEIYAGSETYAGDKNRLRKFRMRITSCRWIKRLWRPALLKFFFERIQLQAAEEQIL